jgi:SAM-dependent methyltransferase
MKAWGFASQIVCRDEISEAMKSRALSFARPSVAGDVYSNGEYYAHNPDWHAADAPWKASKVRRILSRNQIVPGSICDIGCGTGDVLRTLGEYYPTTRLFGRDISPLVLAMGGGAKINRSLGSVDGAPHCDVALALDVFEHVEDCAGFLRGMTRIAPLKVYHVPLEINLMATLRGTRVRHRLELGHVHFFNAKSALALLRETGHTLVDLIFTCGPAEMPRSGKQRVAAMPRRLGLRYAPHLASRVFGGFSMMVLCH